MSDLTFRNVDVDPDSDVETWPHEALLIALDRGLLPDWQRIAHAIGRSPWGPVARAVEDIVSWSEHGGVDLVFRAVIDAARERVVSSGRERWSNYVRTLRRSSGLSLRAFAHLAGTSASRISDYEHARVAPTTDALARMEHATHVAAGKLGDTPRDAAPAHDRRAY